MVVDEGQTAGEAEQLFDKSKLVMVSLERSIHKVSLARWIG
jgi:hypothetical protein